MSGEQIIYGIHAVQNALQTHPESVLTVWCDRNRRDKRLADIIQQCKRVGIDCQSAAREELDRLAAGGKHQGVAARCTEAKSWGESQLLAHLEKKASPLVLALDGVQDPHNLGACLRTADAAGVDAVIAPKDRSVGITPTVVKVASGAAHNVPFVQVTNLARTLEALKQMGLWVTGADDKGEVTLYDLDFTGPTVIVMGAEGTGLRRLSKEKCDYLAALPMAGTVSSLNVSVATGVCLYEVVRQRRTKP
jgi:23S rRNA (guanosine2251-2'-O)-methyltransferase